MAKTPLTFVFICLALMLAVSFSHGNDETDPFLILGIDPEKATEQSIKDRFRARLRDKGHIDSGGTDEQTKKLIWARDEAIRWLGLSEESLATRQEKQYKAVSIQDWLIPSPWRRISYPLSASAQIFEPQEREIISSSDNYLGNLTNFYRDAMESRSEFTLYEVALIVFDYSVLSERPPESGSERGFFNGVYKQLLESDESWSFKNWKRSELFLAGYLARRYRHLINDIHLTYQHPFLWRLHEPNHYFGNKITPDTTAAFANTELRNAAWVHFWAAVGIDNDLLPFVESEKFLSFWDNAFKRQQLSYLAGGQGKHFAEEIRFAMKRLGSKRYLYALTDRCQRALNHLGYLSAKRLGQTKVIDQTPRLPGTKK